MSAPDWGLFAELHELIDQRDPRLSLLSTLADVHTALPQVESTVRSSMWNVQRHAHLNSLRKGEGLNELSLSRGVELRLVLPAHVARRMCPLASSRYPHLRLAPVGHPLLVIDRRLAMVANATGDSIWTTTAPELVGRLVRLYENLWQAAEPAVPVGEDPPFTPRMVEIGIRLVDGETDRQIAKALGVSERTVSTDVRELSRRLGARSRTQAIALIAGVSS